MIVILVVIMRIIHIPLFFTCNVHKVIGMYRCHSFGSGSLIEAIYSVALGFVYCIIPSCVISILNVMTLRKIQTKSKFRAQHQTTKHGKSASMNRNLTITMLAVCIIFTLTTLPGRVISIIRTISEYIGVDIIYPDQIYLQIAYILNNMNHSINFILYCMTGSVFRQTFISLFQCCRVGKITGAIEMQSPTK